MIDDAKVLNDQVNIIAKINDVTVNRRANSTPINNVTKGATAVTMDVTHGLRYMPLLGSLATYVVETSRSAFVAKSGTPVAIKGVWYGALDLRRPDDIGQEIAPAIDVGGLSRIVD